MFKVDWPSFGLGVVAAGAVGYLVFRLFVWLRLLTAPLRPQPVAHLTQMTPWQVVLVAISAFLRIVGLATFVAAAILLLVLRVDVSELLYLFIGGVALMIVGWIMHLLL